MRYEEIERGERLELIRKVIRSQEHMHFQGGDRIASQTAITLDDAISQRLSSQAELVLVPREPTEQMIRAFFEDFDADLNERFRAAWLAAVDAVSF